MSKLVVPMLFALLTLSSFAMVGYAFAQSIARPSIPEFTLKLVTHPYDVPEKTTTTIDEYTGKETTTIQPGYHVESKSIEIIIKNQYCSSSNHLFYNVHHKGHYGDYWTELFSYDSSAFNSGTLLPQSSSEYTVLSIPAVYPFIDGAEVDFQLEALLWHNIEVWIPDHPGIAGTEELGHYETRLALHSTSGWSSSQTISMPENTPFNPVPTSTTPMPLEVPEPSEIEVILGLVFMVAIIGGGLGLLVYLMKRK